MAAKKLATFRIDVDKWQAFQQWAKRSGTNASALLTEYIEECLDMAPTKISRLSIDRNGSSHLDQRVDDLENRLKHLETSIESVIKQAVEVQIATIQSGANPKEQEVS